MLWRNFNRNGNGFGSSLSPHRSILQEWDQLQREMSRFLGGTSRGPTSGFPAMNVWSGKDGALITVEVPGVEPGELDISVVGETITLSGERNVMELQEGERFHRRERGHGRFNRTLELPFRINPAGVEASFNQGVLHITLPRAQEDKPRKINVKVR